jgi:hypothetical protein
MLAQNFLPCDELRCSEATRNAAIKVLGMLEREEMVHTISPFVSPRGFNMMHWWLEEVALRRHTRRFTGKGCGTVGCIGGWMQTLGATFSCTLSLTEDNDEYLNWSDVFFPSIPDNEWGNITLARAAQALRAKLTTGKADWS